MAARSTMVIDGIERPVEITDMEIIVGDAVPDFHESLRRLRALLNGVPYDQESKTMGALLVAPLTVQAIRRARRR